MIDGCMVTDRKVSQMDSLDYLVFDSDRIVCIVLLRTIK